MSTEPLALLAMGVVVAVVLLALLVNLFRAMTRFALAVGAVLALMALCAVALSLVSRPTLPTPRVEIVTQDQSKALPPVGPSAAVAVRRFLVGLLVAGLLGTVGAVTGQHWWQERQRQARLREALQQAQVYALLSGERLSQGLPRRLTQGGGNVIVLGGQQEPTQASLLDEPGWEVIQ